MRKGSGGFSMVEMLVVTTIILVLVTSSISILGIFMRGQGLKQAGRVVSTQFMNARQKSTSEKVVYFLEIDTKKQVMRLWRDADPVGPASYDRTLVTTGANADIREGDEHPLPKNVEFACDQPYAAGLACQTTSPAFKPAGTMFFAAFYPDGTCIMPGTKQAFDPDKALSADLVLVQDGQTAKLFMDVNPGSGKIRKQAFRTQ